MKDFIRTNALIFLIIFIAVNIAYAQVLRIEPGKPAQFEISLPSNVRAGEAVQLTIIVKDAAGNVVTNYDRIGGGVTLSAIQGVERYSGIDPNRFSASAFRDGKLTGNVVFTKSGAIELEVQDPVFQVSSRTGRINVRPGQVSLIKVVVPADAKVGEPFDLGIELYDAYGNSVIDFDRYGGEVILKSGTKGAVGAVEPSRVLPTYFNQGRAQVKVRYTQAERTSIMCEIGSVRGTSREIEIRAGALHTYEITVPSRPIAAGEPFVIIIEAKDQDGNTIIDYNRSGPVVQLKTTGTGNLEPSTIPPTAFSSGIAMVNVRYNVVEKIGVIAEDAGGTKRGESRDKIEITGGRLGRFEVISAEKGKAGEPLAVQIIGYDLYGNLIKDYSGRNLNGIISAADASPLEAASVNAFSFKDGIAFTAVTPTKSGSLVVQIVDEITGAGGRSNPVQILPGDVSAFSIHTPTIVIAHELFEAEITAFDRFGNIVSDYNRRGKGVVVKSSGQGDISPAAISPASFENGTAKIKFTCNLAEEISIEVAEQGGVASGKSSNLLVTHSAPGKFVVDIPSQATAGEPVKLKVRVLDNFGNPVVGYSVLKRSISLFTENGEPMTPQMISSSIFRAGEAEFDAVFIRTGDAVVTVEEAGSNVSGKSSVIRVLPSKPAILAISAPLFAEAGIPMNVRIEMRDKLNNRIRDYSPQGTSLAINVLDSLGAKLDGGVELGNIRQMQFREGIAEISVLPKRSGKVIFEAKDQMLNVKGRSNVIEIGAGPVDHFKADIASQAGLSAGEPIKLLITAYDAFENVVRNFGSDGSGIRLSARVRSGSVLTPATGIFLPSTINGAIFKDGKGELYAVYDKAEAVELGIERIAPGTLNRLEVVTILAAENAAGTLLSVLINGTAVKADVRRVTESIFELELPGAILSASGTKISKSSGIVSMVAMNQYEDGVRILIHTSAPASVRSAIDANRIILSVEPVIAVSVPPSAPMIPQLVPSVPQTGAAGGQRTLPSYSDVDRLIKENRFSEALQAVNIMLGANPGDAALMNLKRRLELLVPYSLPSAGPVHEPFYNPPVYRSSDVSTLQNAPLPVQNRVESSQNSLQLAENEVRAGRYSEALSILNAYLASKPNDETALRMKQRIEQLMQILNRGNR